MKYLIMITMILTIITCTFCTDLCKTGEYRCKNDVEEVCADGDWLKSADCSEILSVDTAQKWVCCESSELYDGGPGCDLPEFCE
jgi:hypothetical protein